MLVYPDNNYFLLCTNLNALRYLLLILSLHNSIIYVFISIWILKCIKVASLNFMSIFYGITA